MERLSAGDPHQVGDYRLLGRLGEGGMGRVYLARSGRGRTVAVKCVRAELAEQADFRRRFAQEITAARRVGGTWTAAVLDADTDAARPWVATGYIAGPSLTDVVEKQYGPLPARSASVLGAGLVRALRAIHGAGLVHRDFKPSNILVTIDGPRVIDFGIARALDEAVQSASVHTRTGALVGSPGFMSPEQVRGLRVTPASDVFCLGTVLAYAATGRQPFGSVESGIHALLFRIAAEEPELDGLEGPLLDLVTDCLTKDPEQRPDVETLAERTKEELAGGPSGTWLPGEVLAQLGRHAVQLLDSEDPESPGAAEDAATSGEAVREGGVRAEHVQEEGVQEEGVREDGARAQSTVHAPADVAEATSAATPPRPSTPPPVVPPQAGVYGPPAPVPAPTAPTAAAAPAAYAQQPWQGAGLQQGPAPGPVPGFGAGPSPHPNTPPPRGRSLLPARSARNLTRAFCSVLGVTILWELARLTLGFSVYNALESADRDQPLGLRNKVTDYDVLSGLSVLLELFAAVLAVAMIVLWCTWFWRVRLNAEVFAPNRVRYSPEWSIFAWFVPVCNFFVPKQVMNDLWKASRPEPVIRSAGQWHGQGPYRPPVGLGLVHNWWWLWLLSLCLTPLNIDSWYESDSLSDARETVATMQLTDLVDLFCCIVTLLMVLRLTSFQEDRIKQQN